MATCHHLSGATWPVNYPQRRHRSHCRTIGQRWPTTVNDGQRQSTVADHHEPQPDHHQNSVPAGSTGGSGQRLPRGIHVAADVAGGILPSCRSRTLDLGVMVLVKSM
ncbi:hypothetical protein Tco_0800033 [Tanacetum coccineum]|uniref:Uncharacterized protein n=1 Tax=Tanacetum coccineum TaxID=301880 RepID=A0ABQ4ZT06_9ASTR